MSWAVHRYPMPRVRVCLQYSLTKLKYICIYLFLFLFLPIGYGHVVYVHVFTFVYLATRLNLPFDQDFDLVLCIQGSLGYPISLRMRLSVELVNMSALS